MSDPTPPRATDEQPTPRSRRPSKAIWIAVVVPILFAAALLLGVSLYGYYVYRTQFRPTVDEGLEELRKLSRPPARNCQSDD